MVHHAPQLPGVSVLTAVGAAIDFLTGNVKRAPHWTSQIGLEWLYRLIQVSRRLAPRYLLEGPPISRLLLRRRFTD